MTQTTPLENILFLSFELGNKKWVLTFGTWGSKQRRVEIPARDLETLDRAIKTAKQKFGLAEGTPIQSCYEAGRDGFWLHRALGSKGVKNVIVDSASIEVDRRMRRAKSDRLDGMALLNSLRRHSRGDRVWRVVRVPTEAEEDARRLHREMERLARERTSHRNRIRSLLVLHGLSLKVDKEFAVRIATARLWDGTSLGKDLAAELKREYERLALAEKQLHDCRKSQSERLKKPTTVALQRVAALKKLKGVATGAWVLGMEFFGWREFQNRRQVGALAGLTGTPYQSGASSREQGISKAGNKRVRALMVELAWCWLRYQPDSKISRWYAERFGSIGKRSRRFGIVAVARQLLVALWRYVEFGEVPEGAKLKEAA